MVPVKDTNTPQYKREAGDNSIGRSHYGIATTLHFSSADALVGRAHAARSLPLQIRLKPALKHIIEPLKITK